MTLAFGSEEQGRELKMTGVGEALMHCELGLQWVRPLQLSLDVGAHTLIQRKGGRRQGRGERRGLESGGRYKTGSPEDLVPCSLC